ncbi:hypothetical protein K439DRAFT_1400235 [Ramaria rubella]|nr:hypothetical protein K439DRAFT_1400235 [Ramaria rubella]
MQPVSDVWHVANRLGKALVFNPPGLSGWAAWLTLIIRTIVVLVLFRRNIAPFLLARITQRIRARSISIRSIKGLYVRGAERTWRVERIGWSFQPWSENRMSVKIEGLHVEIARISTSTRGKPARQTMSTSRNSMSPIAIFKNSLILFRRVSKWLLLNLSFIWLRTRLASVLIFITRLFIRCLPSLTQNLDFELDSVIISFEALSGAHIIFRGVTLYTKIDFSQLDKESENSVVIGRDGSRTTMEGRATLHHWSSIRGGADRFWERIWAQTEGFAAVDVAVREIVGRTSPILPGSLGSNNDSLHVFLHIPAPLRILVTSQFIPKHMALRQHSLACSLVIPEVEVSADGMQLLLELSSQEDDQPDGQDMYPLWETRQSPYSMAPESPPMPPVMLSPTSPTSPFRAAFSQIYGSPAPPVQRLKEHKVQPILALKTIDVSLPSLNITHTLRREQGGSGRCTYLYNLDGLVLHVGLSNAKSNPLHRQWLGSGDHSMLDGSVYSIAWKIDMATISRLSPNVTEKSVCLVALEKMEIGVLVHQWPPLIATTPRFLSGDPNGSFVACNTSINKFQVTERLEELRTSVDLVMHGVRSKDTSSPKAVRKTISFMPRLELGFVCGDIRAHISTGGETLNPLLLFHTPGFSATLSASFRPDSASTSLGRGTGALSGQEIIHMDTTCHVFLRPTFINVHATHVTKHPADIEWDLSSRDLDPYDPLLGIDGMELSMTSSTLGHFGNAAIFVLDIDTSIIDIRCIVDHISMNIWKPEIVATLSAFFSATQGKESAVQTKPWSLPFNDLSVGVTAHFAIGCLTCVVTAPDLNPNCDLEISRGLELRTGMSLQCCCIRPPHAPRLKVHLAYARDREQLGLSEDLLPQTMAIVNVGPDLGDIPVFLRSVTWQSTCRNVLSTRYECSKPDIKEDDWEGFISIPRTVAKVRLRRRRSMIPSINPTYKGSCDISVNVPHLRSRLDLLNTYSTLLALHIFQIITPRAPDTKRVIGTSNIRTTFMVQVGDAHIFCYLPLQERVFIQVLSPSLELSHDIPIKIDCTSVLAWVSSPQVDGKWEELSRICGLHMTMAGGLTEVKLVMTANGVRISIPHKYLLSELILNINIMAKAFRHLRRIVKLGHFMPVQSPTAEAPRHVPTVDVIIRSVTLEAADSPFEAKLGLIWKTGFQAQKIRLERELAFEAKLRAIMASGGPETYADPNPQSDLHYHFTSKYTTSVTDARSRLYMVHSNSWLSSISRQLDDIGRKEDTVFRQLRDATKVIKRNATIPIDIHTPEKAPPLFRAVFNGFRVTLVPPTFPGGYESFLAHLGGMPPSTKYSLLLPIHVRCSLDAAMINIRDYPLPLLNIPPHTEGPSLDFVTDLIVAEEMGSNDSVEWIRCPIVPCNAGIAGASQFFIQVPKTIMPVKSYANPDINFRTAAVTEFTWGVSYNPAIQEVMRVVETLSHPSQDPSPPIGFWDKLRLVFHWRILASFKGGAHLHFKGSRDPYHILGVGAGFDFRWDGNVTINIGHENAEKELIQLSSDSMVISIPDHKVVHERNVVDDAYSECGMPLPSINTSTGDRKICARFNNGIRWGIGLSLERTCDSECDTCQGDTFSRQCRFFTFIPHYEVILRSEKCVGPNAKDSYTGFRSNFIHLSTSLTSPLKQGEKAKHNSFHLTPRAFAHFWSWWHLFDGALSLPIRQGSLFPESRPPSKKFGRHLATIKYRILFSPLYIAHVYKVDSGDAWSAGESHCVGVKAFIEQFQADMHQREEEISITRWKDTEPKITRHKPFSAVDVVITGLDLRALFGVFSESQKKTIPLKESLPGSTRFWEHLEPVSLSSTWVDTYDYMEVDWLPTDGESKLYIQETAQCPRFVYLKRPTRTNSSENEEVSERMKTKFGDEETHLCFMGKERSAHEVQLELGASRLAELRSHLMASWPKPLPTHLANTTRESGTTQMITLLERYTQHLSSLRASSSSGIKESGPKPSDGIYDMPTDIKLPQEIGEFANVYQVHCPKIHLNNATRDILQQYYLASRARRGFEYHMSARAVKFIRDQALTTRNATKEQIPEKRRPRAGSAHAAAQAVRRILTGDSTGDERAKNDEPENSERRMQTDPLYGWNQGVSERKAHLCLLLKPQIVLRSERSSRSALVLAADHVVLQNYGILDTFNADDPVSGYVMQRNYADINSLQVFRPVQGASADHLPLEIFLDFRCESCDFDRLVPQTNAVLRYDKFNRLRLRNDVTTVAVSSKDGGMDMVDHLIHETDLIDIEVPRFSTSADASAFASMADVVTDLLLFSDPVHKARMTQLEEMLFSYDFTDLPSAAKVIVNLQSRIRQLIRMEGAYALKAPDPPGTDQQDLLASRAHIFALSQELNTIFDAIRLAQDKTDERNQEKKSALRLQVSSAEISWQMLDENRKLLAKLAVRGINFSWLSRQDGSTTSVLRAEDLQAFDGSPNALWPEILAKHDDPPMHRMNRRGLFAEARWSVLAPVGGISIYDHFELELHPIRLALETHLGNKLVDYLIPGRRSRREARHSSSIVIEAPPGQGSHPGHIIGTPTDALQVTSTSHLLTHPTREMELVPSYALSHEPSTSKARLVASRSFSNLKSAAAESHSTGYHAPGLPKSSSSTVLVNRRRSFDSSDTKKPPPIPHSGSALTKADNDASEMRHRSAQKTFVYVRIPSVHVLLSVMKGQGFLVRDARLRTHDLEWRNRTSSFEELLNHFIPSDPSLRGWVKVAWQQPVFSVGGVVKELITKTQWGRLGKHPEKHSETDILSRGSRPHPQDSTEASSPPEGRDDRSNQQSRPPSNSRSRKSSLFRRPLGTRKSSVDSGDRAIVGPDGAQ